MIGRNNEKTIFNKALNSDTAELIPVTGRRRVGKTYLIREFFKDKIDFELVGLKDANASQQLRNFSFSLLNLTITKQIPIVPEDWLDAFHQLIKALENKKSKKKKIVFFDELPWLATHRSGFMTGFNYFWNSYASTQNIIVIICGSAASWMIKNVINDKGGLHNRVTRSIFLKPFTLSETKDFFKYKKVQLDHYQIVQLYMVMGGIPHYLNQVEAGKSAVQIIDIICFKKNGFLRNEFDNLYKALFRFPDRYEMVIKALATKWKGLTREEVTARIKLKKGGGITTILKQLEQSGFITAYYPFAKKKKDKLYRLTDYYSLFYLKFIEGTKSKNQGYWHILSQTQSWKSWSGYAFENLCLQHTDKIKEALGIHGIFSEDYSFIAKPTQTHKGAQIDLLIDRSDQTINMCEIKFYNDKVTLTSSMANNIRNKRSVFKQVSKTRKHIFITLLSTYGMTANKHSIGLIDNSITMDDLF